MLKFSAASKQRTTDAEIAYRKRDAVAVQEQRHLREELQAATRLREAAGPRPIADKVRCLGWMGWGRVGWGQVSSFRTRVEDAKQQGNYDWSP